jgi:hypothetical protein
VYILSRNRNAALLRVVEWRLFLTERIQAGIKLGMKCPVAVIDWLNASSSSLSACLLNVMTHSKCFPSESSMIPYFH